MQSSRSFKLILALFVVMLGGFLLHQKYNAQRDDATSLWFQQPESQQATNLASTPVKEWRVTVENTPHPDEPRGTMFEWKSKDGALKCAAGFVYSIGSHAFSNQNQLEFWCRDAKLKPLTFTALARPKSDFPQSYIGNINGELYDYTTYRVYDFDWNVWREISDRDWADLGGALPDIFQYTNDTPVVITTDYKHCAGVSLFSPKGYLGTVDTGSNINSVFIWRGAVYLNANRQVWRATLPQQVQVGDGTCQKLDYEVVSDHSDWIYTFFPFADSLYYGGSLDFSADVSDKNCAQLYRWDDTQGRFVGNSIAHLDGSCGNHNITEIYSFTPANQKAWVGNFPHAGIVELNEANATLTNIAAPTKDDYGFKQGQNFYRESQTVSSSYGQLFIGMFPWAEFYQINPKTGEELIQRLIAHPKKEPIESPYNKDGITEGSETDHTHWGQRITRIAVLNGKLCAGTGNKRGKRYSAADFPNLDEKDTLDYGKVFCANLPNHTMAAHQIAPKAELRFVISDKEMLILADGVVIARSPHSLSAAEVAKLADDGQQTWGKGDYGTAQGELKF
ncbi:MAG: hypothetical protein J0M34_01625 [Alphaproteobacteria bacterium]|nr:hypothetical protein [Alphaproteobacteria bacterium]